MKALLLLPLLAITAGAVSRTQKSDIRLTELIPISQIADPNAQITNLDKSFSMGGVVYDFGVANLSYSSTGSSSAERQVVYRVPDKATAFSGSVGVPDMISPFGLEVELKVSFYLDGKLAASVVPGRDSVPEKFQLSVAGVKGLKIVYAGPVGIGDPSFTSPAAKKPAKTVPAKNVPKPAPKAEVKTEVKPTELARVAIDEPENGATFKDQLTVKWQAVEGATMYGVEIVLVNASDNKPQSKPLRAFNTKTESFEWNFSDDVVNGEYQLSVIAFNKRGVISKFSAPKRIKIERKGI
jgi:hypothetical protein